MNQDTIYTSEELKQIQRLELECLRQMLDVCRKLDIEAFLIGGSALGAVRHGGFIPWDDDIDVGMTRVNYRRFLEQAPALLPSGYELQTPYNAKYNPYFYSKLRVDGTRFVEYSNHRNRKMHHGVYVDIFPFDEVPDDEKENLRQFKRAQRYIKLFTFRQTADISSEPKTASMRVKSLLRRGVNVALRLTVPRRWLIRKAERVITAYNGTGQSALACLNFPKRKCEYVLRTDLYPLTEIVFEDLQVRIPGNYDAYLTTHYGRYMELPPEEERFGHKPYEVSLVKMPEAHKA